MYGKNARHENPQKKKYRDQTELPPAIHRLLLLDLHPDLPQLDIQEEHEDDVSQDAAGSAEQQIARIDVYDGRHDTSGDHIVGGAQPHKQRLAVALYGYDQPGHLCHDDLIDRHDQIAQAAVRKKVQLQHVRGCDRKKHRSADRGSFWF